MRSETLSWVLDQDPFSGNTMGWGEGAMNRWSTGLFGAVKFLRIILSQWVYAIKHLSKLIGCTTPTVSCNVDYGLRVIDMV